MGKTSDEHYLRAATQLGDFQIVIAHKAIHSSRGVKLIDRGVRVDSRLYHRLLSHKLQVPIDESLTAERTVTPDELRGRAERLMADLSLYGQLGADDGERAALLASIGRIALPQPIAFRLTVARDCRSAVFQHSLQVALVALYLGIRHGLRAGKLRALAAAALLHDIGMLHIDPEILKADHPFSGAEQRQLHAHPLTATMIVQERPEYPPEVARAILEHHERYDGSGYPRGLRSNEISVEGRILLLAEVVTALLDKKVGEPGKNLSLILRLNHGKFDPEMSKHILQLLEREAAAEAVDETDQALGQRNVERLKCLGEEFDQWCQTQAALEKYAADAPAIGAFLTARLAALQRSLADAGLHPDNSPVIGIDAQEQAAAVTELAMLMRETRWQLNTIIQDALSRFTTLEASDKPGECPIRDWLLRLQEQLRRDGSDERTRSPGDG
ncbi:HD domain-containing phosphohydrolase [Accumulibacter sp.]|uniref:HD-GYP domain-containing protein n=1 Tax=Accumulibacter sp. TaxID=2053492 RepID=UPI00263A122B|nr:HD domain-containing phosphohydrolase [Accumulibacter sp.]